MRRYNAFPRNLNTINWKRFSHTRWNIKVKEISTSILERDKILSSLNKYEMMYPWGKSLRTKVVNNTVYHFVGSNLGVEIYQKRVTWNRRLRPLCTLCIGVSRKFHLHFTVMFFLIYYKIVQILYKNWLLISKITWEIWITADKQRKSKKLSKFI